MGGWLIRDISVADVHFQMWMLIVTAFFGLWLFYVWMQRQ
jgi:hypothetical protein